MAHDQITFADEPGGATHEDVGITVTELSESPSGGGGSVLGGVFGVYERHGFDAGYRRAVRDVRLSLLSAAEDFIRRRALDAPAADGLRQAAWDVAESLDAEGGAGRQGSAAYLEGGLGI